MRTSPRTLRLQAQEIDRTPVDLTTREQQQRDKIMATGGVLLARNGTSTVTIANLALGLNIAPGAIRRHFATIEGLLAELLLLHLRQVATALGTVPFDTPNLQQARRAAYFAATHTPSGACTDLHWLLLRDRRLLPPEDRAAVEIERDQIGLSLAGDLAAEAFQLLDSECLSLSAIEAAFAAIRADIAATLAAEPTRPAATTALPPPPPKISFTQPPMHPEPSPLSRVTWTPSIPPELTSTPAARAPPAKIRA